MDLENAVEKVINKKLLCEAYQRSSKDIVCVDRLSKDQLKEALKKLAGNIYYVLEKPAMDEMLGRGNGWIK